ncbi:MAG: hypothetical protein LBJ42_02465 [Holosporales bacterium]|nr:hypothetical protein [Holosporales bacterium]
MPGFAAAGDETADTSSATRDKHDYEARIISQITAYLRGLKYLFAEFQQDAGGVASRGKIWLSNDGVLKIKVEYREINQEILAAGDSVTIVDHLNGKEYSGSTSSIPACKFLTGKEVLSTDTASIVENSKSTVSIKLNRSDCVLIFTKYERTGNVKDIHGWSTGEGTKRIEVLLDEETVRIGDKKAIPAGIFSITRSKS